MRLRIGRLNLEGTDRAILFHPGLNVIEGPVASGKTTLLGCIRGIFGSRLNNLPREATRTITAIAAEVGLGEQVYTIVRPFVTTTDAKVDIAGESETLRLPVLSQTEFQVVTYGKWLLSKLHLPDLQVPTASTKLDSELSPITINDYLMYCNLQQDEIDNSVFGHDNYFKDNKRKHVFNVLYGRYDIEAAQLQEQLRDAVRERNGLRDQAVVAAHILEGTPFANRAEIERELGLLRSTLSQLDEGAREYAQTVVQETGSTTLLESVMRLDIGLADIQAKLEREERSLEQMHLLIRQLENQSNRLTRSIVAEIYLVDYDFLVCPRCGSPVNRLPSSPSICYLCHQEPQKQLTRTDLIKEQDRIERQIIETRELVQVHEESIGHLSAELMELRIRRANASEELDRQTNAYVSDTASRISNNAAQRAQIAEKIVRLTDYLLLYRREDEVQQRLAEVENRIRQLQERVNAAYNSDSGASRRIGFLEEVFRQIVDRIGVPRFIDGGYTGLDDRNYLPMLQGRRFDELQSQGLKVMVNLAHAVAHQIAAIELELDLPNLLIIDGLSANIGYEGLDEERLAAMYQVLIDLSLDYGSRLQIIVADNTVPSIARDYVRLRLDEDDRLIPLSLLT